jgi:hypothetical protein
MKSIFASILAISTTAHGAVNFLLPGTSEQGGWDKLGTSYAGNTWAAQGYPTGYPGAGPWPAPIAPNVTGSTSSAGFMKDSGNGYFSGGSIYDAGSSGVFSLTDNAPLGDLATVILQLDAGAPVGVAPTLSYNNGSQTLAANYFASFTGEYIASGPTGTTSTINTAWQWDLSAVTEEITSYVIRWGSVPNNHLTQYEVTLTAGDSFAQVVPEPTSAVLVAFGSLAFLRRRR